MATATTPITAEELLRMGGKHCELVRGELVQMAPAGWDHGDCAMLLGSRLRLFVDQHQLGIVFAAETGFRLAQNPDTVRAPDVAFVRKSRIPAVRAGYFPGAPDLAVEVVSPHDSAEELHEKVTEYLDAGAAEVWVVSPKLACVTVHRPDHTARTLRSADTLTCPELLPGFSITVGELFA